MVCKKRLPEVKFGTIDLRKNDTFLLQPQSPSIHFNPAFLNPTLMELFDLIRQGDLAAITSKVSETPSLVAQKDSRGFTPLVMATYSGHLKVAEYLLSAGADVNAQDAAGNTALMGTCFKGHTGMVELLLNRGADVNLQNFTGSTALIFAATYGQTAVAKLLLAAGADPSLKDTQGMTALGHARAKGQAEMVALLEG